MCLTSTLEKLVLRNVTHLRVTWTKLYTLTVWEKPLKKTRIEQNLTQEQLGERIGVKRAQKWHCGKTS